MLWDYVHLCFEKVITALLLRLLMAVQIASSFLSYTVGMEGKYLRLLQETSTAVAASTNQTSAPATVSSRLCATSFMTDSQQAQEPILCKLFHLTCPQSISLAKASGRTASLTPVLSSPLKDHCSGSFPPHLPQAMRFSWEKVGPLIPSIPCSKDCFRTVNFEQM